MDISMEICEQRTQKLILNISNIIDQWYTKDVTVEEHAILDKTEIDLDLSMTNYKTDMKKRWYIGYINKIGSHFSI